MLIAGENNLNTLTIATPFYNEEEGQEYYYFPISGLKVGDELEIVFTKKMAQMLNGDQFLFQDDYPIFNSSFFMICPIVFNCV